jgi:hypothetical protein
VSGGGEDQGDGADVPKLPFPDSLCHRCAAPPRYIWTERSVFIRCPILKTYPPQPVAACAAFVEVAPDGGAGGTY